MGASKMAAAAIFWLYFLNIRSSIQSFFEISGLSPKCSIYLFQTPLAYRMQQSYQVEHFPFFELTLILFQQLCSSTRDALEHLSKKIYCTSEYKDSMKATVEFEETAAEYQQKGENKVDELHEKGNDFSELKDWEVIDLEEIEKQKPSESDNERSNVRSAIFFLIL